MFPARTFDDLGTGRMFISEHTRQGTALDQRVRGVCRKGRYGPGEIAPVEHDRRAGDFPMPGRRVLAAGPLGGLYRQLCAIGSARPTRRKQPAERLNPGAANTGMLSGCEWLKWRE